MMLMDHWFEKFRAIERKISFIKTEIKNPDKNSRELIKKEKERTLAIIAQVRQKIDEMEIECMSLELPKEEVKPIEQVPTTIEIVRPPGKGLSESTYRELLSTVQGESDRSCGRDPSE